MVWTDIIVIPFVLILCGVFCWLICAASGEEGPPDAGRDERRDK